MLAGLAALPVIWWLLRLTPPRPEFGRVSADFAPSRPQVARKDAGTKPLVAHGPSHAGRRGRDRRIGRPCDQASRQKHRRRWRNRFLLLSIMAGQLEAGGPRGRHSPNSLQRLADDSGQTLILAPTAGPAAPLQPLTPAEFRQHFASLTPQPYPGDRAAACAANREGAWLAARQNSRRVACRRRGRCRSRCAWQGSRRACTRTEPSMFTATRRGRDRLPSRNQRRAPLVRSTPAS